MANKRCAASSCENKIREGNITGYCQSCMKSNVDNCRTEYQRMWAAGENKQFCISEGCDRALTRSNKSGYCKDCYQNNPDLRTKIHKERYLAKVEEKRRESGKAVRICASESCDKVLRVDCKTPYCKKCRETNVGGIRRRYRRLRDPNIRSLGDETQHCDICNRELAHGNKSKICKHCRDLNVNGIKSDLQREQRGGTKIRVDCLGCGKLIQRKTTTGYCWVCTSSNVDGILTANNWSPERMIRYWREKKGIIVTDQEAEYHFSQTNCQLCHIEFESNGHLKKKCLDHDHETGHYRGTICGACNTGLGKLGDNLPKILEGLFQYYSSYAHRQGKQIEVNLNR